MANIEASRLIASIWTETKEAVRWLVLFFAVLFFLFTANKILFDRLNQPKPPWDSDFAMFWQAGKLAGAGEWEEVYRYIGPPETKQNLSELWSEYIQNDGGWGTYFYGHTPWHALLMAPLGAMEFKDAFEVSGIINMGAMLFIALVLALNVNHKHTWAAVILTFGIILPIIGGYPWDQPNFRFQWMLVEDIGTGIHGNSLSAAFWLGQPTPLIFALVAGYLIAAKRRHFTLAALLGVLAVMKPSVIFVLPLVILVTKEWWKVIKWGAIWGICFSIFFGLIPDLWFPNTFLAKASAFSPILPFLLEPQNWLWLYGSIIVALALKLDPKPT